MGKLNRLREAVIKGDKRSFIDSIHDFSEEDIVDLTEQQCEDISKWCSKIKLNGVEEFFDFLLDEVEQAIEKSITEQAKENSLIGRFYSSIFMALRPKHDIIFAKVSMNLGIIHINLAELGIDAKKNLEESIRLQQESQKMFPKKSLDYAISVMNQGVAHLRLGELGIDAKKNFEECIKLQQESKKIFPKISSNYGRAVMNQGTGHQDLGEFGIEPIRNFKESIKKYHEARNIFQKNTFEYGNSIINLGYAHLRLGEHGIDTKKNLEESIKLQQEAREIFQKNTIDYATATMNQGYAHEILAEKGVQPIKNLKKSIKLQKEAREIFSEKTMDYATSTMNQANSYGCLAEIGIDPEKNFKESIELFQEARKTFPENSNYYGRAIENLANSFFYLAGLGIDIERNLNYSIKLQEEVRKIFPENSIDYGRTTINQGNSHSYLAEIGINPEMNFNAAKKLYETSINIFLDRKDGWKYPLAVLNCYKLYRHIFLKSGDKSSLLKAGTYLKDAKKDIDAWDFLGKNVILGEFCAVEADLYELEKNYFDAGVKYRDAYQLTEYEYYKFMCEFCSAKFSKEKNSFCKLVTKWEKVYKEGIFLDFYDYAIFECNLEVAVENVALRFIEINTAKSKLDEIYARTYIHHIKTRVGACIDILNAYLNYFPEKETNRNEGKAIECITNACMAFKSQGNEPEIDLCNMFSKAIKNKDSQDVWIDLIKNHLSNNLSKLIGEAAINELTKSQTREIKAELEEIKAGVKEIKESLDEIKSEIITRFEKVDKDIGGIAQGDEALRNLLIDYANKTKGILLNLLDESKKCDSEAQKFVREFTREITKKLEERDDRWFEQIKDELIKKETEIEEKMPTVPSEIKSRWRQLIDKLKKETKEIIREIPKEAVVIVGTEKILEYGAPFLSAAIISPAALPALIAILYTIRIAVPKDE